jgi:hypothetical protein
VWIIFMKKLAIAIAATAAFFGSVADAQKDVTANGAVTPRVSQPGEELLFIVRGIEYNCLARHPDGGVFREPCVDGATNQHWGILSDPGGYRLVHRNGGCLNPGEPMTSRYLGAAYLDACTLSPTQGINPRHLLESQDYVLVILDGGRRTVMRSGEQPPGERIIERYFALRRTFNWTGYDEFLVDEPIGANPGEVTGFGAGRVPVQHPTRAYFDANQEGPSSEPDRRILWQIIEYEEPG